MSLSTASSLISSAIGAIAEFAFSIQGSRVVIRIYLAVLAFGIACHTSSFLGVPLAVTI